ncbi:hypothetical protein [Amycolatopsis albispora]|uniref:Uncharacterized protein n=1 Tax=Amycolatopsis albispora TaxID=1804986 RepID=A0A344L8X0_9PSEU|nr:hypothetical protein [Amycolatopsis albispora]AXB44494.1 hypothetical protein A4R43_19895 [Amycolatopsis albispora]
MHEGTGETPQLPSPIDLLAAFPCPAAVADAAMACGPISSFRADGVNGNPWGLDALYWDNERNRLLTVRTVRPSTGLDPHGLPGENASIQLVNFLAPTRRHPQTAHADYIDIRSAVQQTEPYSVDVAVNGTCHTATRIDVLALSVVELAWEDRTVFATGQPSLVDRLTLRSAHVADLTHLQPRQMPSHQDRHRFPPG